MVLQRGDGASDGQKPVLASSFLHRNCTGQPATPWRGLRVGISENVSSKMTFRILPSESNPGAFEMTFDNPKCTKGGRCIIYVVKGEPAHPFHGWNGDHEKPTITPSIGCDHRCGWHGFVTNGVVAP